MARGRKAKPRIDQLRASFWYWALEEAATQEAREKMSDEELAQFLGRKPRGNKALADPKQLGRYRRGEKNPSEQTLRYVERLYPGTKMFFESGPWFSYLWVALDPSRDPQDALTAIETPWRNGVHVEHEVPVGDKQAIQNLVVPGKLAERWDLAPAARVNLVEKCQPWERLGDLCAQLVPSGAFETYAGGGVLTLAPSATFTKAERLETSPKVRLPFFAGLSYRIAQARIKGENNLTLNLAAEPHMTSFAEWLLAQLLAKLPDGTGFHIALEDFATE